MTNGIGPARLTHGDRLNMHGSGGGVSKCACACGQRSDEWFKEHLCLKRVSGQVELYLCWAQGSSSLLWSRASIELGDANANDVGR